MGHGSYQGRTSEHGCTVKMIVIPSSQPTLMSLFCFLTRLLKALPALDIEGFEGLGAKQVIRHRTCWRKVGVDGQEASLFDGSKLVQIG